MLPSLLSLVKRTKETRGSVRLRSWRRSAPAGRSGLRSGVGGAPLSTGPRQGTLGPLHTYGGGLIATGGGPLRTDGVGCSPTTPPRPPRFGLARLPGARHGRVAPVPRGRGAQRLLCAGSAAGLPERAFDAVGPGQLRAPGRGLGAPVPGDREDSAG